MTLDQEIFMDQSHPYIALGGLELTDPPRIDPSSLYLALDHLFTPKSIPAKDIRKDITMVTFLVAQMLLFLLVKKTTVS